MRRITFGSSMSAISSRRSPQRGHARTSKPRLRGIDWKHIILEMRGALGHPPAAAARTDRPPLTGKRHEAIEPAPAAAKPGDIQLTVTVTDPKFYTKPWTFMRANLYWMKAQDFAETLCVPSEALEYRDSLAKPSGINIVP